MVKVNYIFHMSYNSQNLSTINFNFSDMYKNEIRHIQPRIAALDRMHVDMELMKKVNSASHYTPSLSKDILGMTGSFKRLEID